MFCFVIIMFYIWFSTWLLGLVYYFHIKTSLLITWFSFISMLPYMTMCLHTQIHALSWIPLWVFSRSTFSKAYLCDFEYVYDDLGMYCIDSFEICIGVFTYLVGMQYLVLGWLCIFFYNLIVYVWRFIPWFTRLVIVAPVPLGSLTPFYCAWLPCSKK